MDGKEFKKTFEVEAKSKGFESAFGGWFKESSESIVILELQKSSFSNSYYLNIKVFIQGAFGRTYTPNKDLIKSSLGHVTNQIRDKEILDLDASMGEEKRKADLARLFSEFIMPFTDKVLSKLGIKELADKGEITLLPAVREELA